MAEIASPLAPAAFAQQLLKALDASEGRTMRRKRDQLPDVIGLGLKRGILVRAVEEAPANEAFEGWLMQQALSASASGGILAMCAEILAEYRLAALDESFHGWLAEGAPSADAQDQASEDNGRVRAQRRLGSGDHTEPTYPLTRPLYFGEDWPSAQQRPDSPSTPGDER